MHTTNPSQVKPAAVQRDQAAIEAKRARLARLLLEGSKKPAAVTAAGGSDRLDRRFEAQAHATPAAVALAFGAEVMTYIDLDRRADSVARTLVALGVGRGTRVAIFVERSAAMIVGLLGVLKAGGTYVPLDPAIPADRLRFVLDDSEAPVILAHRTLANRLHAGTARVVWLDEADHPADASLQILPRPADGDADDVAYVIYTSGSTGRPQGG